jgi:tetratricopeptide (TPR) repeat protein
LFGGDPDGAAELLRESASLFAGLGNHKLEAASLLGYAAALSTRGRHADALAVLRETLAERRELGPWSCVWLNAMGMELHELGDHAEAREMFGKAIASAELHGHFTYYTFHSLADLELDLNNLEEAEALYRRALAAAREVRHSRTEMECLAGLASVAARQRAAEASGQLWGVVERMEVETGEVMLPHERKRYADILAAVHDEPAFRRGYELGRGAEAVSEHWRLPTVRRR